MSNILILAFLFFAGCLIGWGIEVIFRRFEPNNKARKWINPGFLIGPYLPLYGFGLCTLYLLAGLEKFIHTDNTALQKFILFLLMAIAMTVIELIAGEIFIVKIHSYGQHWARSIISLYTHTFLTHSTGLRIIWRSRSLLDFSMVFLLSTYSIP